MGEPLDIWDPATHRAPNRAMDEGLMTFVELDVLLPTDDMSAEEVEAAFEPVLAMGIRLCDGGDADTEFDLA